MNPKNYVDRILTPGTAETYAALPKTERERRVWFWPTPWFKRPRALAWDMNAIAGGLDEWDKTDTFLKKKYPVQFRLRQSAEDLRFYWEHYIARNCRKFWSDWIIGQRTAMKKAVFKRYYRDLEQIIVDFHAECLIEFVDREKALERADYSTCEENRVFEAELRKYYEYAKTGKQKLLDDAAAEFLRMDSVPFYPNDKTRYAQLDLIEKQMEARDTEMCEWVIRNRDRIWC